MRKTVVEKLDEVLGVAQSLVVDVPEPEEEDTSVAVIDVPTQEVVVVTPAEVVPVPSSTDTHLIELDEDIRDTRKTLKFLIETGKTSLEELQMIATETEEPRPYEVLGELIKSIADVSKELVLLHKTRADIVKLSSDSAPKKEVPQSITQNNMYLNTTDLVKMIREGQVNANNPVLPE